MGHYEIFRDKDDQLRFRLMSKNGRIIATSEGYRRRKGVMTGIASVKKNADSYIVDKT